MNSKTSTATDTNTNGNGEGAERPDRPANKLSEREMETLVENAVNRATGRGISVRREQPTMKERLVQATFITGVSVIAGLATVGAIRYVFGDNTGAMA